MTDRDQRVRMLLDDARRGDDPPPGAEQRVQRQLMKRLAVGVAAGGGAFAVKSAAASVFATAAKAAAIGAVVGAAAMVAQTTLQQPATPASAAYAGGPAAKHRGTAIASHARPVAPTALMAAPPPASAIPDIPASGSASVEPPVSSLPSLAGAGLGPVPLEQAASASPEPATPPRPPPPRVARSPGSESGGWQHPTEPIDLLQSEAAGLRSAHEAMQRGEPGLALALVAEQNRTFREGALGQEREAVRILALCHSGRSAEARAAARTFLETSPRSPLVPRVRATCSEP